MIAAVFIVASCGDDDPVTPPQKTPPCKGLCNQDDILFNLELAYNERNFVEFEKLLDDNFTFILSEADYNSGIVDVPQWDRVREVSVNSQIFDPSLPGDLRVLSIEVDLLYAADDWEPEPPDTNHPTETWYTQTVRYDLVVKTADDWEHRALGLNAELKIRQDEPTGQWQIVVWRDDVGAPLGLSPGRIVEETTWGSIKALYK